jgi:hypothetical protein
MVKSGRYHWVNDIITSGRFKIEGYGQVECYVRLFNFERQISSDAVVEAIQNADNTNRWQPGRIEHLLAFGAKYAEEQLKYPLVALGSAPRFRDDRCVPFLDGTYTGGRHLYLHWWNDCWNSRSRFLAIREVDRFC